LWRTEEVRPFKVLGILISLLGCVIAISEGVQDVGISVGIGDGLVLLLTMMMAAYMVLSAGIANHLRALPANTLMFGSSSLILSLLVVSLGALGWPGPPLERITPLIILLVVYVGVATATVFLLRYLSLRSLPPITVGVYHNLVPVCTILLACLSLGEEVGSYTIVGGVGIIAGAEVVRRT
jgi:drug/metabolite transporter (DMT)-like permease